MREPARLPEFFDDMSDFHRTVNVHRKEFLDGYIGRTRYRALLVMCGLSHEQACSEVDEAQEIKDRVRT